MGKLDKLDGVHHRTEDLQSKSAVEPANDAPSEAMTTALTVGVVGVGALLFEAALIPGMLLGVACMLAPKYMPKMSKAAVPMLRSTVRGAYKIGQKTREMVAEAQEHVNDIVAEVQAEGDAEADKAVHETATATAA